MADKKAQNKKTSSVKKDNELSSNVKGTIAIMLTLLVVIIVVMIFAKSLFVGGGKSDTPAKTGAYKQNISYAENPVTTPTTKAQTTQDDFFNDDDDDDFDESGTDSADTDDKGNKAVEITCVSAVYLHPTPYANAPNLATIPVGAKVKFYRNDNGWYYVEYNGQKGYAYSSFFSAPQTTATNAQ